MTGAINFSGLASGIDSSSLIKSILEQERKVKINPLEEQISDLSNTNESLSQLSSLLESLKTNASAFRTLNAGGLSNIAISSDESVITASATSAAYNGKYSINVIQLAKNATFSFGSSASTYSSESDLISSGSAFSDTVTVKIGSSSAPIDTVTINLDQDTTLTDFISDFNSQTSDASASLVNVGSSSSPNYRIVLNTKETGLKSGGIDVTIGGTLSSRNSLDSNIIDNAKDAIFNVAGIATGIVRSSNSVSDVINGVTLKIQDSGSSTINIGLDSTRVAPSLKTFVDSLNQVIKFARDGDAITQQKNGSEVKNIFGPLSKTVLDNNLLTSIRGAMTSSSISGGLVNTLSDLGISTQRDGSFAFDEKVFNAALTSDPTSIQTILSNMGEKLAAVDGTIAQFTRFNGLIDSSENANTQSINSINNKVAEIESNLSKYQDSLTQRFSALEVLTGKLQSAQSALAGLPR